jgi:hypothetical protein
VARALTAPRNSVRRENWVDRACGLSAMDRRLDGTVPRTLPHARAIGKGPHPWVHQSRAPALPAVLRIALLVIALSGLVGCFWAL